MSGPRSIGQQILATDELAMAAQRPVSALTTLQLRDNMQHLVDVSVQQRINWVASTSSGEYGSGSESLADLSSFAYTFPTTITDDDTLPSYDVRVATRLTGTLAGARMHVRLNAHMLRPGAINRSIASATATISTAGAQWHAFNFEVNRRWKQFATSNLAYYSDVGAGPFLESTPDTFVLVTLEIQTVRDDVNGLAQIVGVYCREYL